MIVIEFGDYAVPLAANEWRRLEELAGGSAPFAGRRECTARSLTSVALDDRRVVPLALALEAERARCGLSPGLLSLCKDLFDYADLVAARRLATTA